jgi:hypothetical protein
MSSSFAPWYFGMMSYTRCQQVSWTAESALPPKQREDESKHKSQINRTYSVSPRQWLDIEEGKHRSTLKELKGGDLACTHVSALHVEWTLPQGVLPLTILQKMQAAFVDIVTVD